nr:MAG TPA: YopX protein [Caudoviricetes sp.]
MIPKYRAWDREFKEMVQVNALVFDERVIKATYKNGNVVKEDLKNYELMQSTGLLDKNGQEIFAGDIVEFEDEVWYTDGGFYENKDEAYDSVQTNNRVVIIYDGFEWDLDNFWKGTNDCSSAWMSIFEDHMQSFKYFLQNEASVIGNIYENPELLEANNDRD